MIVITDLTKFTTDLTKFTTDLTKFTNELKSSFGQSKSRIWAKVEYYLQILYLKYKSKTYYILLHNLLLKKH